MTATVGFTQMRDGTREDYELLHGLERQYVAVCSECSSRVTL